MLLLRSWKESLALFIPKNFKLFFLVTLKSALETYGYLAYHYWWLVLLVIVFDMGCYYPECLLKGALWIIIEVTLKLALAFVLCALVRPSVPLKNYAYMREQARKSAFGFVLFYIFFTIIRVLSGRFLLELLFRVPMPIRVGQLLYGIMVFTYAIILPVAFFSFLFFLDSHGTFKEFFCSVWRGIKMFIYNLPFCVFSCLVIALVWELLIVWLHIYGVYLFFSFVPFVVSYFKNMYVKRLHDRFNIYFTT